jgi:hypothetical protein
LSSCDGMFDIVRQQLEQVDEAEVSDIKYIVWFIGFSQRFKGLELDINYKNEQEWREVN